ncbi:MAG: cytochrome c3 family protein [Desulfobulbales bacterium]|nr:cytochrome c3 family protein [Desulfobulbales bacterium]
MRTGKIIINVLIATTGLLWSCPAVQAGEIGMPDKPIIIGTSNPVEFDHVLHRSLDIPCGECHHDDGHNPRGNEEIFAIVDGKELHCKNCHNKDFANTFLQNRKDIFHTNCKPCHAVGINGNRGPRKCNGCHIKDR